MLSSHTKINLSSQSDNDFLLGHNVIKGEVKQKRHSFNSLRLRVCLKEKRKEKKKKWLMDRSKNVTTWKDFNG